MDIDGEEFTYNLLVCRDNREAIQAKRRQKDVDRLVTSLRRWKAQGLAAG